MVTRSFGRKLLIACIVLSLVGGVTLLVSSESTTYGGVTFPYGDLSFADRVVAYRAASCVSGAFDNPRAALGPPDCEGQGCVVCDYCDSCAVALGFRLSEIDDRGYLILEFVDNRLADVPGDDLFIYITNTRPCRVEISVDGTDFLYVGEATSYPTGIDIAPFAGSGEVFRFVRLSDVPADEDPSHCPGPSIDAVGAMGPAAVQEEDFGTLQLLAGGELASALGEVPKNILIIVDSSSSMAEAFEDSTKIDVAKEVLMDVVNDIPTDTLVGLRMFGQCNLSRLLSPIGPLNRGALNEQVLAIQTGGPTPIAYALEQAKEDLVDLPDAKLILLVSDGQETCHGDPVAVAEELMAEGYQLKIHVVGLALEGDDEARTQLRAIADASGGLYFDVQSREELRNALRLSIQIRYTVYDQQGREVFVGSVAKPGPQLPTGTYRVVIDTLPPLVLPSVSVQPARVTTVTLQRADGVYTAEVKY
jgi:hypothetical protein